MIDQDFCDFLEYKISEVLTVLNKIETKGFWCDGVCLNNDLTFYSQKYINDKKQTNLKAFVGEDGQSEYKLTLKFGNKALSKYVRNLEIKSSIPTSIESRWFKIDTESKEIEIQLN